jgi:hypothetical protein
VVRRRQKVRERSARSMATTCADHGTGARAFGTRQAKTGVLIQVGDDDSGSGSTVTKIQQLPNVSIRARRGTFLTSAHFSLCTTDKPSRFDADASIRLKEANVLVFRNRS